MKDLHPKVEATAAVVRGFLETEAGTPIKCTACYAVKPASPAWAVGVFQPHHHHKAGLYLVCPACQKSKQQIQKAARFAETALRDLAESEGA